MDETELQQVSPPSVNKTPISIFKSKEDRTTNDYFQIYLLESISIFLWLYGLVVIFVYNIDFLLINKIAPNYIFLLKFKFLAFLVVVSIVWKWIGSMNMIIWFFYIVFYPLVLLFKLFYFVLKQKSWLFAFALINSIFSFFKNLKYRLFFTTLFLVSFCFILFSNNKYILTASLLVTFILTLATYFRSFLSSIKPSFLFQIYSNFFKKIRSVAKQSFELDPVIRALPVERLDEKQLQARSTNLQTSILFNRICLFVAKRLREYQKSSWKILPSIFSLFGLAFLSVLSFSGMYYGLFSMNPAEFGYATKPSFFNFFYFSFSRMMPNLSSDISAIGTWSQVITMLQVSLGVFLFVILTALFISNRYQQSTSEIDEVINDIETQAQEMDSFIQSEFSVVSIDSALEQLKEAKAGMVQILFWLTKSS